eukprot:SAG31_NODE_29797_length_389_cov_3.082759_1_plen_84_part_10
MSSQNQGGYQQPVTYLDFMVANPSGGNHYNKWCKGLKAEAARHKQIISDGGSDTTRNDFLNIFQSCVKTKLRIDNRKRIGKSNR